MVDKLEEKLVNIENKLDGEEVCPVEVEDKLGWHLDYIESLIDGGSGGAAKVWSVEDDTNMDTFASSLKPGDMFNDGYSICIVGVVDTQNRRMVYLNVTDDNTTSYNDIYWYEGYTWLDTEVNVSKIFVGNEVGSEGITNIWDVTAEMFDSLESYNESMKVGDIIVDRDEHLVGIIEYIEFTNHELSNLSIMYNHGQAGVGEIYFDAGDNEIKWVQQRVGTKLYKHEIVGIGAGGPPSITIISARQSPYDGNTTVEQLNNEAIQFVVTNYIYLGLRTNGPSTTKLVNDTYTIFAVYINPNDLSTITENGNMPSSITDTVTEL